jgi:hypothetical protein
MKEVATISFFVYIIITGTVGYYIIVNVVNIFDYYRKKNNRRKS